MTETFKSSKIKRYIDNADIVSFDIFDTLILRKLLVPTDVFTVTEIQFNSCSECSISDFRYNRMKAEKRCRVENKKEVTIEDIYKKLSVLYGDYIHDLRNFEEGIEKRFTYRNETIYKLYRYATHNKKRIFLITDMYLDKKVIEEILSANGICEYDSLYVSSESGYQKCDGKLYEYIKAKEHISIGKRWIHVGDNVKSDHIQAIKNGIHSFYIKKNRGIHNIRLMPSIYSSNRCKEFGYNVLGPLMLGYCNWIYQNISENKINKVFFFSREGFFIKRCFERIYSKNNLDLNYLYVSRKSLLIPILNDFEIMENLELFRNVGNKTILEYLYSLGIKQEQAEEFLQNSGLNKEDKARKIFKKKVELSELLYKETRSEFDTLSEYLTQQKVFGKFAIIDVGWTGTMQIALQKVLERNMIKNDIYGFFLGQRPEMNEYTSFNINNKGWLCSYNDKNDVQSILLSGNCLFELLFMAPHGTTIGYKRCGNGYIEPVLDNNEYIDQYDVIRQIQDYAIKFLDDYTELFRSECFHSSEECFQNFRDFLLNPQKFLVELFGDMDFNDSGIHKIAPECKSRNPLKWIDGYYHSYWKVGYLKRNIRMTIPYLQLYRLTRTVWGKMRG